MSETKTDGLLNAIKLFATRSSSAAGIENMIKLSRSESGIAIAHGQLDQNEWLFNVANGTLDLRTGDLHQHRREDLITKLSPVAFSETATCPLWDRFVREITQDDEQLARFLRRLVGYSLTGSTQDHVLPFLYGSGANGKSVFTSVIMSLLGPDYAMRAAPELLMAKSNDSHPTERADLFGRRLVISNEIESGRRLNESLVKDLTGGDRIRARRMREDFWEFSPTHKIWLVGNHKPLIRGTDIGIWRRVKLIPFTRTFADSEQDKTLTDKLLTELPGIFNWAIKGCLEWQRNGLGEPDAVRKATSEYRDEQDVIGAFIAECCVIVETSKVKASLLYAAFKTWADTAGEKPISQRIFGEEIVRKFERKPSNGIWYLGLGLRANETE